MSGELTGNNVSVLTVVAATNMVTHSIPMGLPSGLGAKRASAMATATTTVAIIKSRIDSGAWRVSLLSSLAFVLWWAFIWWWIKRQPNACLAIHSGNCAAMLISGTDNP